MANFGVRLLLFFSSYAPLLVILSVRNYFNNRVVSLSLLGVAIVSVLTLFGYLRVAHSLAPHGITVNDATSKDGDAMSYIVTYIIPFLDAPMNEPLKAISLGILFAVLGVLYINSNLIYTNPMLNLHGYHVFQIETTEGKVSALITRRSYIRAGSDFLVAPLGDYVLLEIEK